MFTLRFEYLAPTITGFCDFLKTHFCHQSGRHWPDLEDTSAFKSWSPGPHVGAIPGPWGAQKSLEQIQTLFGQIQKFLKLWSRLYKPEGMCLGFPQLVRTVGALFGPLCASPGPGAAGSGSSAKKLIATSGGRRPSPRPGDPNSWPCPVVRRSTGGVGNNSNWGKQTHKHIF